METTTVRIERPETVSVILGQAHFIKTVEDIHEAMVNSVPGIRFGVAFCEASGDRLVRKSGTDEELVALAARNALAHLRGELGEEETRDAVRRHTRRFARRQLTWFRKMPYIEWIDVSPDAPPESVAERIRLRP